MKSIRPFALLLPFLALTFIALAVGAAAHVQASADEPTEYSVYRNDRWHYSLAVPADMTASEYDREGGGHTTQFMDAAGDKELLISAWPYTQLDLTLGREGAPSTNADQPDHLEIVDVVRDDAFTALFQKNGIRYVVVTLPKDEVWLADILTTWRFTE